MTTTAALPPTIQTVEPIRPRAAAVRADWSAADAFDVEKGTMGGYTQAATEDLTFSDLVDLINPLQHIPGVSQVYRALTGDTIKPAVKVMGGLVFGGPAGLLLGAGGAVVDSMLGDPLARVADAALGTNSSRPSPATSIAAATAPTLESAVITPPDTTALQQVAELPKRATNPGEPVLPQSVRPDEAPAPAAEPKAAGPADIGAAGEATLAALMAASQPRDLKGAEPPNRFDLAAYNGNAGATRSAAGKDIRTYFATAVPSVPVVRRPPVAAAAEATAEPASAKSAASAPAENAVGRASDPTVRNEAQPVGEADPTTAEPARAAPQPNRQVPPWFADRVLQNLERYGGAGQPARKPTESGGASSS